MIAICHLIKLFSVHVFHSLEFCIKTGGSEGKSVHLQCGRVRFDPWVRKIHWRRKWQPTPVLLTRKFHGRKSLVGYSPWDCKELHRTEPLLGFPCSSAGKESTCNVGDLGSTPGLGRSPGEGKGYPLQYSVLENSMDSVSPWGLKELDRLSDFHFTFTWSQKDSLYYRCSHRVISIHCHSQGTLLLLRFHLCLGRGGGAKLCCLLWRLRTSLEPTGLMLFSQSVLYNSLRPHRLQHSRLSCPSLSPGAYSNSCPLSQCWHPTISFSVVPFSSCPQSFPAWQSFLMSQFFASGGHSTGASASASVLPMNIQDWFPLELTLLIS